MKPKKRNIVKNVDIQISPKTIFWYDAVQKDISPSYLRTLNSNSVGKELLAVNKTYGKIRYLKDVVMIIHEESTDGDTDVTIIPKDWIIKIT